MLVKERYFEGRAQPRGEIGIEIEMEGNGIAGGFVGNPTGNLWTHAHDGSLRGESIEMVLKQPIDRESVAPALRDLDSTLKKNNAIIIPSVRTGVHIHVNVQGLTMEQTFIFQLMWLLTENAMVGYCGEDRTGNLFCLRSTDAEVMLDKLHQAVLNNEFKTLYTDELRYSAMNPKALCEYGSLEFRCLKTPDRMVDIATWVSLLLKLKDYSVKLDNPVKLMGRISLEGADVIAQEIFGELIIKFGVIDWTEVLYDGLRRIQPIVYCRDWEIEAEADSLEIQVELPQSWEQAKLKNALTAREVVDYNA